MAQHQRVVGYAALDASGHLAPFAFTRRRTGPEDVTFKVLYCGICATDLHLIHDELNISKYPMVPGHEIVGVVTEVGVNVKKFKIGDHVGVGCMVWSCHNCDTCEMSHEQFCEKRISTYNSVDVDGTITKGGYSSLMVANQSFVLRMPENLPLDASAPLLCAGITVYSPMKNLGMEKGKSLGVVGLGGLGHTAVKIGKAFGMNVTVISTSPSKEKEAIEILGADHFLISTDSIQMQKAAKTLDYIIDTVSAAHPLEPLIRMLKVKGKLVIVAVAKKPLELDSMAMVTGGRWIGGTCIGGIQETQEMLDFCGEKNISCTIEKIPVGYVNAAMERLKRADVKYRFVIDVANTLSTT